MPRSALYNRAMSGPVQSGDVLAGKYQVERVLGEGGMGVVVAARHLHLGQMVALKFLRPEAVTNQAALGRFVREARNAVRLKSEHAARILDVGTLDDGAPYIVMEFLQGSDLSGVLAQRGPLPVAVAVDYLLQACDAIAEAHSLGIIHRDLKPQNLFMTQRHDATSLVKVLDFGISKSLASEDFVATRPQEVMGTPAYMSPEQMRSSKLVDARTDVWALGVILYELVVGKVPWEAETLTELCFKVAMDPLPPLPAGLRGGGFEEVVRRCLEKDPARRISDVAALASALLPLAPEHARPLVERIRRVLGSSGNVPPVPPLGDSSGPGTLREASGQRPTYRTAGSRKHWGAVLAAALVLASLLATAVTLGGGRREEAATRIQGTSEPGRATTQPAPQPEPATAVTALPPSAPAQVSKSASELVPALNPPAPVPPAPRADTPPSVEPQETAERKKAGKRKSAENRVPVPASSTAPRAGPRAAPARRSAKEDSVTRPSVSPDPLASPD